MKTDEQLIYATRMKCSFDNPYIVPAFVTFGIKILPYSFANYENNLKQWTQSIYAFAIENTLAKPFWKFEMSSVIPSMKETESNLK